MREILFRGKPVDNKRYKWVHDDGFCYGVPAAPYQSLFYAYYKPYEDDEDYAVMLEEIDPDTIGQYTGLTDKNGKKIFEGDIVTDGELRCEVVFIERYGCFQFVNESTVYAGLYSKAVEVLGNIFDNPELIGRS